MKASDTSETSVVAPMSSRRRGFVYVLLGVLVIGHLVNAATEREHWPFGPYLMFSQASGGTTSSLLRMKGVTDEAMPREIMLSKVPAYFAPMPVYHIRLCFDRALWLRGGGKSKSLETLCHDYLARYEQRRLAGLHQGPPLKGLRLYRYEWTIQPDAANAATPDRVTLIYDTLQPNLTGNDHAAR